MIITKCLKGVYKWKLEDIIHFIHFMQIIYLIYFNNYLSVFTAGYPQSFVLDEYLYHNLISCKW